MKFETTDELIEQAEKDGACETGIAWCRDKELQEVLETIPQGYRLWCLERGYGQFAEYCDWSALDGFDWAHLLLFQPQFAERCDWSKLGGYDWSYFLRAQPQFAGHCDWS